MKARIVAAWGELLLANGMISMAETRFASLKGQARARGLRACAAALLARIDQLHGVYVYLEFCERHRFRPNYRALCSFAAKSVEDCLQQYQLRVLRYSGFKFPFKLFLTAAERLQRKGDYRNAHRTLELARELCSRKILSAREKKLLVKIAESYAANGYFKTARYIHRTLGRKLPTLLCLRSGSRALTSALVFAKRLLVKRHEQNRIVECLEAAEAAYAAAGAKLPAARVQRIANLLIREAHINGAEKALALLGAKPSADDYLAMATSHLKSGRFEHALEACRKAHQQGVVISRRIVNQIFEACTYKNADGLLEVLRLGYKPRAALFALITHAVATGRIEALRWAYKKLGQPIPHDTLQRCLRKQLDIAVSKQDWSTAYSTFTKLHTR